MLLCALSFLWESHCNVRRDVDMASEPLGSSHLANNPSL